MGFVKDLFNKPKAPAFGQTLAQGQQVASGQQQFGRTAQEENIDANRINQQTPFGSVTYGPNGATTQYSPEQQAILDALQRNQQGLGGTASNLIGDTSGMYSEAPDFSEAAGTQTNINMQRFSDYMNPTFTRQTEEQDNRLRNQGLTPGTPAYDRASRELQLNQGQVTSQALNQYQQNAFNQAQQQYQQPLNTIQQLMGLSQPAGLNQSFVNPYTNDQTAPNLIGAQANTASQAQAKYEADLKNYQAALSGAVGLAGTAMGAPPGTFSAFGGKK